ncbi:MAG: hypothetical protein R2711_12920 [Acidimicrobiales bacterium]
MGDVLLAVAVWGPPAGVLSTAGCASRGSCGFEVLFEASLRDAGIRPSNGRPFHPDRGEVNGSSRPSEVAAQKDLARSIVELQQHLDAFCHVYNHEQPHQGIGEIPVDRWNAVSPLSIEPLPTPATSNTAMKVSCEGVVNADWTAIHIGVEWAGEDATMLINHDATVLVDGHLVRHLTLDRTRHQPSGRPAAPQAPPSL